MVMFAAGTNGLRWLWVAGFKALQWIACFAAMTFCMDSRNTLGRFKYRDNIDFLTAMSCVKGK